MKEIGRKGMLLALAMMSLVGCAKQDVIAYDVDKTYSASELKQYETTVDVPGFLKNPEAYIGKKIALTGYLGGTDLQIDEGDIMNDGHLLVPLNNFIGSQSITLALNEIELGETVEVTVYGEVQSANKEQKENYNISSSGYLMQVDFYTVDKE